MLVDAPRLRFAGAVTQAQIIKEIDELAGTVTWNYVETLRLHTRAVRVATMVFGSDSEEVSGLKSIRSQFEPGAQEKSSDHAAQIEWQSAITAFLLDFKNAINGGALTRLRVTMQGEVLADFLDLGKQFLADQRLEVAAVLVAAGLEDAMKWCARNGGITIPQKADLSTVANALIRHGLIDGAEKAMVHGLFPFRNNALHADWTKLTVPAIQSAVGFLEGFLQKHFS